MKNDIAEETHFGLAYTDTDIYNQLGRYGRFQQDERR